MKLLLKILKVTGITLLVTIAVLTVMFLLARFVFRDQLVSLLMEELYDERMELLRSARPYEADTVQYSFVYQADSVRARETREYFRLDTLFAPSASTWERTVAVARFVAANIPHANQNVQPTQRNAIALWQYTREVEPAFNCRLHSIMLHEMLLSLGITNRFVTCQPGEEVGRECHVVNIVWLPELDKWAMIDSDMKAWATAGEGDGEEGQVPLSLQEMRERYLAGRPVEFHDLLGEERDFDDYRSYWAKNLYWFECWEATGYDRETRDETGQRLFSCPGDADRSVILMPPGYRPDNEEYVDAAHDKVTTDDSRFWAAPGK